MTESQRLYVMMLNLKLLGRAMRLLLRNGFSLERCIAEAGAMAFAESQVLDEQEADSEHSAHEQAALERLYIEMAIQAAQAPDRPMA